MGIEEQINKIKKNLNQDTVFIVAVKYANISQIKEILRCGVVNLGFNTFQQLNEVKNELPDNIKLHFIGHLQSNKIRKILESDVFLIQSVDSLKVAEKINNVCTDLGIKQRVLIQLKTDKEKEYGFNPEELNNEFLSKLKSLSNIVILGLMTIPQGVEHLDELKESYVLMNKEFERLKIFFGEEFEYISMGMSQDYELAIKYGANMVRIGRVIFK